MKTPNEIKTAGEAKGVRGIPEKNELKTAQEVKPIKAAKSPMAPKPIPRPVSKPVRVPKLRTA
jgi:hypothetical protein